MPEREACWRDVPGPRSGIWDQEETLEEEAKASGQDSGVGGLGPASGSPHSHQLHPLTGQKGTAGGSYANPSCSEPRRKWPAVPTLRSPVGRQPTVSGRREGCTDCPACQRGPVSVALPPSTPQQPPPPQLKVRPTGPASCCSLLSPRASSPAVTPS